MVELDKIKEYFKEKTFRAEDLANFLDVSDRYAYTVLDLLLEREEIIKVATGMYKYGERRGLNPSKYTENLRRNLLKRITRKFKFTGLSVLEPFIHHIPYVISYQLFVEKGSAEDFESEIKQIDPNGVVLIEPTKDEIHLIIKKTDANKIIIIRENSYFLGSSEGRASAETAFVDLYFETTRDKIPFIKTDLNEILKDLIRNDLMNYSKLLLYAHERKLADEIKELILKISQEIALPAGWADVLRKIS